MISEEFKYTVKCEGDGCSANVSAVFFKRSRSVFVKSLRLQGWRMGKYTICPNCSRSVRDDSMKFRTGGVVGDR